MAKPARRRRVGIVPAALAHAIEGTASPGARPGWAEHVQGWHASTQC